MRQRRRSATCFVVALGIAFAASGYMPEPISDDNGNVSFVRQAVPKLLGRKPKGAEEVRLLADLAVLVGRERVVRMLMAEPEFVAHWTDVLVDGLKVQREGRRGQPKECFGTPVRSSVTAGLASLLPRLPSQPVPVGGAFNMTDLIASSIVLDDLSPIFRAYPLVLVQKVGLGSEEQLRAMVGDAFNHAMLNRQFECLGCHNSASSVSNHPAWQRTHAIPLQLEAGVYGLTAPPPAQRPQFYGVFRRDQLGGTNLWGMVPECGTIMSDLSALGALDSFFAGTSGTQLGLIDVDSKFRAGADALARAGVFRTHVPGANPTLPGAQAYAFMVAATFTENVWEHLLGEKLTISNYYPRTSAQRDVLWHLTERVFIPGSFSLKDLIAQIITSRYFNRAAPDSGTGATAYEIPLVLDPWVERDPRPMPQPPFDPKEHNNGQGELVHRYSPRSLFYSVAAALGWPEPKRYPDASYPDLDLVMAMGQYLSDVQQGTRGVDFQGLLTWEARHGTCQKPVGVAADWVDRLVGSIPGFDAANATAPLTVADLVGTIKDWLIGEPSIATTPPRPLDPAVPVLSEQTALAGLFGTTLNTPAATVPDLAAKARRMCGVLLQSPRFLLAGIEPAAGPVTPRHRVCNGAPCTYEEMCRVYRGTLARMGWDIYCLGNRVSYFNLYNINLHCPAGDCQQFSTQAARSCELNPLACPLELPPKLPPQQVCAERGCPYAGFDLRKPSLTLMRADNTLITMAQDVGIKLPDKDDYRMLQPGETLRAGDVLRLSPGAVLEAVGERGRFATPGTGMPSRYAASQRPIDLELIAAAERGRPIAVEALLDKQANIDARDPFGETPLMKAAAGDLGLLELLLARGADLEAADARGFTAADFAALGKQLPALELLAKRGLHPKPEAELALSPSRIEPPWSVLVVGNKPPPLDLDRITPGMAWELTQKGVFGTQALGVEEIRHLPDAVGFGDRNRGGPLPRDAREAEEAVRNYMRHGFAREHPGFPVK